MDHVVIIGNGISGITAARHIRKKSDKRITVISSESDFFFSRTALMYIYMGHMKFEHTKPYEDWFWKKNRIELLRGRVVGIDASSQQLELEGRGQMSYDSLIIATGSRSRMPGCPGQDLQGVQGLYSLQDLESMERSTHGVQEAVIAGGGLIGVEMAEMMHSRGIEVTMLIMESGYWRNVLPKEESELITRHLEEHGIRVLLNTQIEEILSDEDNRVSSVRTRKGENLDCQFVGLTIGVQPNIAFLEGSGLETNRGVLVDEYLRTNLKNIYAIGDCSEQRDPRAGRRSIEAVWYTGRMMGEVVAASICEQPSSYKPGVWFNSAKFFDIEYQTYGMVLPDLPETEASFYWEHDSGKICLRLVYKMDSLTLTGINVFGMRLRHEVCDEWINAGVSVSDALKDLRSANFDPEFYNRYEEGIVEAFNSKQLGPRIELPVPKRFLTNLFK